jgi:hypothetical protein
VRPNSIAPFKPSSTIARSLARRGRGEGRETLEAIGALAHRLGDKLVGRTSEWDGSLRREDLYARRRQRQHLHVDSGFIHAGNPLVGEVEQSTRALAAHGFLDGDVVGRRPERPPRCDDISRRKMFFETDGLHSVARHHESSRPGTKMSSQVIWRFDKPCS